MGLACAVVAQTCSPFGRYRCQPTAAAPMGRGIEVCNYITNTALVWQLQPCGPGTSCVAVPIAGTNASNYVCALSTISGPECVMNARRCVGNSYQTCVVVSGTAQWSSTSTACGGTTPVCSNGQCVAAPTPTPTPSGCVNGAYKCVTPTIFNQCSNGVYYNQSCAAGTRCYQVDSTYILCDYPRAT